MDTGRAGRIVRALDDGSRREYRNAALSCSLGFMMIEPCSSAVSRRKYYFGRTSFRIEDGHVRYRYRLKNVNAGGRKKVWRYHAYDSYTPTWRKKSTLIATLKKVDAMASDREEKWMSAVDKLREFAQLGYPVAVRREACGVVAAECQDGMRLLVATAQEET